MQLNQKSAVIAAWTTGVVVVCLAGAPWLVSAGTLSLLSELLAFLALAQLWNLLAGYAGIVSLGQQAYIGMGGYMLFAAAMFWNVPPLAAVLMSGVLGGLIAAPIAALTFRLGGAQLAIGTWVVAEVFRLTFAQVGMLGAGSGISLPAEIADSLEVAGLERDATLYLLSLVLTAAIGGGIFCLLRSRYGLALTAIRDNEPAASASGVDCVRVKFAVYVAVAAATSMVGAVVYLTKFRISPAAAFDINWTSYVIFIVVIGGIGTLEGPLVGTLIYFLLREYLSDLGAWYLIVLGMVAVVVMFKWPRGIWGQIADRYGLEFISMRRKLARG